MASVTQYSLYYYGLDKNARKRYKEKLQKLGGATDPYLEWQIYAAIVYGVVIIMNMINNRVTAIT